MHRQPNKSLSILLALVVAWLPFAGFGLTIGAGDAGAAAMHVGHIGHQAPDPAAAPTCASDDCVDVADNDCCPGVFCAPGGCCSGFSATVTCFAPGASTGHDNPALDPSVTALPPDRANLRYRPPRG